LLERATHLLPSVRLMLAGPAEPDNEALRRLLGATGLAALRELRALPVAGLAAHAASTVAAAARMGDRVHRLAAHGRPNAVPPLAAGLAEHDLRPVGIAHLADRRPTADVDL